MIEPTAEKSGNIYNLFCDIREAFPGHEPRIIGLKRGSYVCFGEEASIPTVYRIRNMGSYAVDFPDGVKRTTYRSPTVLERIENLASAKGVMTRLNRVIDANVKRFDRILADEFNDFGMSMSRGVAKRAENDIYRIERALETLHVPRWLFPLLRSDPARMTQQMPEAYVKGIDFYLGELDSAVRCGNEKHVNELCGDAKYCAMKSMLTEKYDEIERIRKISVKKANDIKRELEAERRMIGEYLTYWSLHS